MALLPFLVRGCSRIYDKYFTPQPLNPPAETAPATPAPAAKTPANK